MWLIFITELTTLRRKIMLKNNYLTCKWILFASLVYSRTGEDGYNVNHLRSCSSFHLTVQFVFLHFCTNSMVLDTANSLCLDWHIKRRGTPWTLYLAMTQVPYRTNLTGDNPKLLSSIRPRESTIHIALFFKLNISCTRH